MFEMKVNRLSVFLFMWTQQIWNFCTYVPYVLYIVITNTEKFKDTTVWTWDTYT